MTLRQYRPADLNSVWTLHLHAIDGSGGEASDDYFADLRRIEAEFLSHGGEFVVGESDRQIVAMGGLKRTTIDTAQITRMRVHPSFQRHGFGTLVLRHLEKRAVELGYRVLHLDTTVAQTQAQRFYLRNGYRRVGTGTKQEFNVIYFEKQIVSDSNT